MLMRLGDRWLYREGFDCGSHIKSAAEAPRPSYSLSGTLFAAQSGWIMLNVPNALVRGFFAAMDEPGVELPTRDDRLNAHISVMRPEDVKRIGGVEKVTERGKRFRYRPVDFVSVVPVGWDDVSRVWFLVVKSPELQELRRTYGLTPLPNDNKFEFHITVAVRRRKVLYANTVSANR